MDGRTEDESYGTDGTDGQRMSTTRGCTDGQKDDKMRGRKIGQTDGQRTTHTGWTRGQTVRQRTTTDGRDGRTHSCSTSNNNRSMLYSMNI